MRCGWSAAEVALLVFLAVRAYASQRHGEDHGCATMSDLVVNVGVLTGTTLVFLALMAWSFYDMRRRGIGR